MKNNHFLTALRSVSNHDGGVLPLIGLAFGVLVLASGFAIDYTRTQLVRDRLQWAVDAAALAGAKAAVPGSTDLKTVTTEANQYFRANFPQGYMGSQGGRLSAEMVPTINGKGAGLRFSVTGMTVKNYISGAVGIDDMHINASAEVNTLPITPLDIVISFDMSASMSWADGLGNSCIGGFLQPGGVAASCDTVKPTRAQVARPIVKQMVTSLAGKETRFGIVPWAQHVDLAKAFGRTAGMTKAVVANENSGNLVTDKGNADPNFGIWEGFDLPERGGTECCGTSVIQPITYLTKDTARVQKAIDDLVFMDDTDSSLGIAWAIKQFEPTPGLGGWVNWKAPAANKVIVFVTDGYNTRYHANAPKNPGDNTEAFMRTSWSRSNARTTQLCSEAKRKGIVIYTIAFNVSSSKPELVTAKNMLRNCASQPDYFFDSANGSALSAAIQSITSSMMTMRLTK